MLLKQKFKNFVASRPIVPHNVYGFEFSIELNLKEIQENKLSTILGYYVNEKKAVIEDDFAYIIPEYENYYVKPQNYKKQKLLKYTGDKNFTMMINRAIFVIGNLDPKSEKKQYFLKINQDDVRKYQCVLIVALLIDSGLAYINESDNEALYIVYDFQQKLEAASKIQSDLSRFRTLLGECNNLAALLQLVEQGKIKGNKLFISQEAVNKSELNIEMVSLLDVGISTYKEYNEEGFELDVSFASWLLEYISNTSDRISFGDLYGN